MNFTLHIWRQHDTQVKGRMVEYKVQDIGGDVSFLEMLDMLNETLTEKGEEPIAFDHDCREGICGACSLVIDGVAHGPGRGVTTCQLMMRNFRDGAHIYVEPWRVQAFPIIKDLVVDRRAFDHIIAAGGYVSCNTGSAPDANVTPIAKQEADSAMDAAQCIGCGACAAACKNSSAMLFVAAKVSHLALLPQGQVESKARVRNMIKSMDAQGFGACTNQQECEAVCPKEISVNFIAQLNRNYLKSLFD